MQSITFRRERHDRSPRETCSFCLSFFGLTADFFPISAPAETPVESYWSTVYDWFWEHAMSAEPRYPNERSTMWLQISLPRTIIWAFSDRSLTHTRSLPEWECEPHYRQSRHVFPHWVVEALHEVYIDLKERRRSVFFFMPPVWRRHEWNIPVNRYLLHVLRPLF